ncbi:MAG: peptide ABC transporter substrate-binding protein [Streptosporangiales bacterium]|nr:peptide ABC transporter substrate-binding protein [Streptosporangiales bacterium]
MRRSLPDSESPSASRGSRVTRRSLLRLTAAGAVTIGAGAALAACGSSADPSGAPAGGGNPKRGGRLRVGLVGGSAKDTLNAHSPVNHPDQARIINLYEGLASFDENYQVRMALAESIEPNKEATEWTVRLRDGLEFHDGKTITADDVAFTFRRITDPKDPQAHAAALATLDRDAIKVMDERTVRLVFKEPYGELLDEIAELANGIVPEGYDPKKPVGSGPFKLQSFTPGEQSVFVRHPNYWREGEPYLDELVVIDMPEDTARVNALLGGQVDAIDQLPLGQIKVIQANPNLKVLESQTGGWLPFTMRVDRPPFDDVRVRQAFRLIVDREEMVRQVLAGHGTVGNDLYGRFDPNYARELPQRKQDIAQAKALLKQAGKENLTVELVTGPIATGVVEAAQVFAQQAKAAGVTVNVRKVPEGEFFGDNYLKWDFAQDFWITRNFLPQVANGTEPGAPYNETHWADKEFLELVREARRTLDPAKRAELVKAAQKIEYERGGYIIWGFPNQVDAHGTKIQGIISNKTGLPLNAYGFRKVWMA